MAKRRNNRGKQVIIIISIIILNFLAVSYGYWSDDLMIKTSITTGKLDAVANITSDILPLPAELVESEVTIEYEVKNIGSIPLVIEEEVIDPYESKTLNFKYTPTTYGENNFDISINIKQWNK